MQEKEVLDEGMEEEEKWYSGPLKLILALFLILLLVLWLVPKYGVKLDPRPERKVSLEEVKRFVSNESLDRPEKGSSINDYVIISPEVKRVADYIVTESCQSNERVCFVKALFYFVRDNFDYVNDPLKFEYIKTGKESLINGGGDCDDASVLLASMLEAVGFETKFEFIPRHVYVKVYLPEAINRYKSKGDWVALDATCDNCEMGEVWRR